MKTYKSTIDSYRLVKEPCAIPKAKFARSSDSYEYAKMLYADDIDIFESMFLVTLNRANITTGYVKISQGGISGTVIDVEIVTKYAIEALASAVLLVHNHPSGNTQASDADKRITEEVKKALDLFRIKLLDHIIITSEAYLSFTDEALI